MNKYDLFKSLDGISEEAIQKSEKQTKPLWLRIAAAAACLALLVSAIFFYNGKDTNAIPAPSGKYTKLLAAPEIPKQVQRPNLLNYLLNQEAYFEAERAWRNDFREHIASVPDHLETLNPLWMDLQTRFLLESDKDNPLISPLNIYFALTMLAETTGGNSRQQILDVLDAPNIDAVRQQAMGLWKSNLIDDGISMVDLGNSLWLRNDYLYNNTAIENLAKYHCASTYSGQMGSKEYNKTLQEWINAKTHNLLAEQVQQQAFSEETIFSLVSTLYLKANWVDKFSPKETRDDIFHATAGDKTVPFLRSDHMMTYYYADNMSAIALPLESGGAMWFFLPDEGVELNTILQQNLCEAAQNPDQYLSSSHVITHIAIPKFDVNSTESLIEGLTAMGIRDVFSSDSSNFSPISSQNGLYVSSVDHAVRIRIDEEGCEAAAYTKMDVAGAMPPEGEAYFYADRPFAFVVTGVGDVPLFAGVINNP